MSDIDEKLEFTEMEALEVRRRQHVAWALIPAAVRFFTRREDIGERIRILKKTAPSYWYWALMVGGVALDFILSGRSWGFNWHWEFNLGTLFFLIGGISLYQTTREKEREEKRVCSAIRRDRGSR